MCGRFATQNLTWDQIVELARLTTGGPALNLEARYNIAPTQRAVIVREVAGVRDGITAQWWLTPHWVKKPSFKYAMFNAKLDGIENKPAFRDPVRTQRCLVPAMNFYEWKGKKGEKVPYFIGRADGAPLCFAGIWDQWQGMVDGQQTEIRSFAILTTAANGLVANIHPRMPVILPATSYDVWLTGSRDDAHVSIPADQMTAFPIGNEIGSVKNEGPERTDLIVPTGEPLKASVQRSGVG